MRLVVVGFRCDMFSLLLRAKRKLNSSSEGKGFGSAPVCLLLFCMPLFTSLPLQSNSFVSVIASLVWFVWFGFVWLGLV